MRHIISIDHLEWGYSMIHPHPFRASLMIALLALTPASCLADAYTDLAAKAYATLAQANSIRVESSVTMDVSGLKVPAHMVIEALAPGYVWQKFDSPLMKLEIVVDDSTTTTVYPVQKKYSYAHAIPSSEEEDQGNFAGLRQSVVSYGALLASLSPPEARFKTECTGFDTLSTVQGDQACVIFAVAMDTTITTKAGSARVKDSMLWIGLNDGLLYKHRIRASQQTNGVDVSLEMETVVGSLILDAGLTPADFVYVPPDGFVREDVASKVLVENSLEGKPAPHTVLTAMDGSSVRLADRHGEILIVDFWATWCAPCRKELAEMKEALDGGVLDVPVLIVSTEQRDVVAAYVKEQSLPMQSLLDGDRSTATAFGVTHWPTLFVIDGDGTIREHFVGYTPVSTLVEVIRALRSE